MAQRISIEFQFGEDASFFCPICGRDLHTPNGSGELDTCEHFIFAFLETEGLLLQAAPGIQEKFDGILDEDDDAPAIDRLVSALSGRAPLVFEVKSGGMACGPVWSTVVYGLSALRRE